MKRILNLLLWLAILLSSFTMMASTFTKADLVLYFPFDEGTGEVVKDSSSNGNDGKFFGKPKWVAGKYKQGLELDGESAVKVPDSKTLNPPTEITVCVWIKPERLGKPEQRLVSKDDFTNNHRDYFCELQADGTVSFGVWTSAGRQIPVGGAVKEKEWHHVAGTYDGETVRLYIDGNEVASGPVSEKLVDTEANLVIGMFEGDAPYAFSGVVDEVAVFSEALTPQKIKDVMAGLGSLIPVNPKGKLAECWGRIKGNLKH